MMSAKPPDMGRTVNFYSSGYAGGAGWFTHELAGAMVQAGMRVNLIAPKPDDGIPHASGAGFSHFIVPSGGAGKGGLPRRLWRTVVKTSGAFWLLLKSRRLSRDYLFTFMDWLVIGFLQFLFIKLIRGRITFIVHDATPHAWSMPDRLRGFEKYLLRMSYRIADRLVTLTEAARRELIDEYGIDGSRVTVIPHGAYVPPDARPLDATGQIILFGALRRNKRVREAIAAFAMHGHRFPRLRLLIAGAPHKEDEAYWRECEAMIEGHESRISVELGFVEEARLHRLIAQSEGVLLAYEDFNSQSGVAVLACFSLRPMIATRAGGIGELCRDGLEITEVSRPVNADTVADALERFSAMGADELRASAARSAASLARSLSWSAIGQSYRRLYDTQR
jgi:glycosyltransferase involved in cell wall biosynthesis